MSTTSTTFDDVGTLEGTRTPAKKGFFDRLIEARMRQGEARVGYQMSRMSDETLAGLGFTAEQIAHIRTNGKIPRSFWR